MELCQAVYPGKKNSTLFGCIKEKGHLDKLHINGKSQIWRRDVLRFKVGDKVWVRDRRAARGGFRVVEAVVEGAYTKGHRSQFEWYNLDGDLWWKEYPGCRVFSTRRAAVETKLPPRGEEWL